MPPPQKKSLLDQQAKDQSTLKVLMKDDPDVEEILGSASHVTLYGFDLVAQAWSRKNIEGTLFVVKRRAAPRFQFMVLNRLSTENCREDLLGEFEFELSPPYLLYRSSISTEVNGIWFYRQEECDAMSALFNRITSAYARPSIEPAPQGISTQNQQKQEQQQQRCAPPPGSGSLGGLGPGSLSTPAPTATAPIAAAPVPLRSAPPPTLFPLDAAPTPLPAVHHAGVQQFESDSVAALFKAASLGQVGGQMPSTSYGDPETTAVPVLPTHAPPPQSKREQKQKQLRQQQQPPPQSTAAVVAAANGGGGGGGGSGGVGVVGGGGGGSGVGGGGDGRDVNDGGGGGVSRDSVRAAMYKLVSNDNFIDLMVRELKKAM